jgi:hypothetical protein
MGSKLLYSFAYHSQIDGKTKVVRQSLGYLL